MNKKKILIFTLPLCTNYGGILQAFALQKVLQMQGHFVCTDLRFPMQSVIERLVTFIVKKYLLRRNVSFTHPVSKENQYIISENTRQFIYDNMNTVELFSKDGLSSHKLNVTDFDNLIVGSDQVWRSLVTPFNHLRIRTRYQYLLDFANNINKIAYSASFGIGDSEIKYRKTKKTLKLINQFSAISVREESGINICKSMFEIEPKHVLDPTMLLDIRVYTELVEKNNEPKSEGSLFTYVLDKTEDKVKIYREIECRLNLLSFEVGPNKKSSPKCQGEIKDYVYPSVTKWLRAFMDSEFVFTDSFHGCVFSILFNKPFAVVMNSGRGGARFSSLLRMFNLENRMISSSNSIDSILKNKIDWDNVNEILKSQRELSLDFLNSSIK